MSITRKMHMAWLKEGKEIAREVGKDENKSAENFVDRKEWREEKEREEREARGRTEKEERDARVKLKELDIKQELSEKPRPVVR